MPTHGMQFSACHLVHSVRTPLSNRMSGCTLCDMYIHSTLTIFRGPHLCSGLHLGIDHTLLKLSIGIKHLPKVPHRRNRLNGLLIDVSCLHVCVCVWGGGGGVEESPIMQILYLLKVTCSDVVVCQRTPELSNHVSEPSYPTTYDRVHLQTGDLCR